MKDLKKGFLIGVGITIGIYTTRKLIKMALKED